MAIASQRRNARGTITRDMPPPQLVIEVVSPGKENQDRDYCYKRSESAARGVAEYWIVGSYARASNRTAMG